MSAITVDFRERGWKGVKYSRNYKRNIFIHCSDRGGKGALEAEFKKMERPYRNFFFA